MAFLKRAQTLREINLSVTFFGITLMNTKNTLSGTLAVLKMGIINAFRGLQTFGTSAMIASFTY